MEIAHQKYSIKEKMENMLARVKSGNGPVPLSEVFRGLAGRAEAIAVFLAVLELLRLRVVRARQEAEFSDILLESTGEDVTLEGYEDSYR
jgi:segregation and condensation protein A